MFQKIKNSLITNKCKLSASGASEVYILLFICLYLQVAITIEDILINNGELEDYNDTFSVDEFSQLLKENYINDKILYLLKRAITSDGKRLNDINEYGIVINGGSTRIPFIQNIIEEYSQSIGITQTIIQTLNLDESNSLGSSYFSLIKPGRWNYEYNDQSMLGKNGKHERVTQLITKM